MPVPRNESRPAPQAKPPADDPSASPEVRRLLQRLARCTNLPSPPSVAVRIIDLAQNPDTELDDLLGIVSADPALASKILRVANSPLHGLRSRPQTLRQAAMLLGMDSTVTLALGFALVNGVSKGGNSGVDYQRFWNRSLASACCARLIGAETGAPRLEDLFLAGLLQDIGILAISRVESDLYQTTAQSHEALRLREFEALGTDHAEIGARMLAAWQLPAWLCETVGASHSPMRSDPASRRTHAMVALGALLADSGWQGNENDRAGDLEQLAAEWLGIDREIWQQIRDRATDQVRETARLFDFDLSDWGLNDLLRDQAREVLIVRNLRSQADLATYKKNAEGLLRKTERLEQQTRFDGLTGLYNRTYLDQALAAEFDKAVATNTRLSLLFIDIDHFKRINDNHGHAAGDQVLRESADLLRAATRRGDMVGRYGGEEFICVLPSTGEIGASELTDRLLRAFRGKRYRVANDKLLSLTVSIGQATLSRPDQFESPARLLKAADDALYRAKNSGRNQCRIAS